MPRNRELMRIFKDLELVEHIGSGMGKIMNVYKKENFEFMEHFLRMSIPFETPLKDDYSEPNQKSREKILNIISKNSDITMFELAQLLKLSPKTIEKHIKILKEENKIKRVGTRKEGYWEIVNKS